MQEKGRSTQHSCVQGKQSACCVSIQQILQQNEGQCSVFCLNIKHIIFQAHLFNVVMLLQLPRNRRLGFKLMTPQSSILFGISSHSPVYIILSSSSFASQTKEIGIGINSTTIQHFIWNIKSYIYIIFSKFDVEVPPQPRHVQCFKVWEDFTVKTKSLSIVMVLS